MKKLNKKMVIISLGILLIIIILLVIYINLKQVKIKEIGEKYNGIINISLQKGDNLEVYSNNFEYDGKNMKVMSDMVLIPVYYTNNTLIYEKDNKLYEYETNYSYNNLYNLFKKGTHIKKEKKSDYYNVEYSKEVMNEILKNLYINADVKDKTMVKMSFEDKKISQVELEFSNLSKYDYIYISIGFNENENLTLGDWIFKTDIQEVIVTEDGRGMTPKINPYQQGIKEREKVEKNILEI